MIIIIIIIYTYLLIIIILTIICIYIHIYIYIYGPASDCHPLPRRDGDGPYLYMDICKITQVCDIW